MCKLLQFFKELDGNSRFVALTLAFVFITCVVGTLGLIIAIIAVTWPKLLLVVGIIGVVLIAGYVKGRSI